MTLFCRCDLCPGLRWRFRLDLIFLKKFKNYLMNDELVSTTYCYKYLLYAYDDLFGN